MHTEINEQAAEEFFNHYRDLAFRIASQRTPKVGSFDYEDVAMISLTQVWKELQEYKSTEENRDSFIKLRLHQRTIDALRKFGIRRAEFISLDSLDQMLIGLDINLADVIEDLNAESPYSILDFKERSISIKQHLSKLSDRSQQIIILYYWDGMKLEDIGTSLERTESRTCQLRKQALKDLRILLEKEAA